MNPLRFNPRAGEDFDRIVAYYRQVAPEAVSNISADIEHGLNLIKEHPGRPAVVSGTSFRRYVTPRYHFKIAYRVRRDRIDVLGIYRFQNRTT